MAEIESSEAEIVEEDDLNDQEGGHDFAMEAGAEEDAEMLSDAGASNDDEVYDAYATYKESRQRLKEVQRSRGFFRGGKEGNAEARREAINKEKARTRCATCGKLGHWSGDLQCSKRSSAGPRKGGGRKPEKGRGKGHARKGQAYLVSESPLYFSLDGSGDEAEPGYCNMVLHSSDQEQDEKKEARPMEQDAGRAKCAPRPTANGTWSLGQRVAMRPQQALHPRCRSPAGALWMSQWASSS